jgi:cellulose synthase/poly-beta-1,6-N-acetylglucosamine synthase-like glycosyltransferase
VDGGTEAMSVTVNGTAAAAPEPAGASDQASDSLPPNPYVSIILPCYNEHGHVTAEVARICEAMDASGYDYEFSCVR